MEYEEIWTLEDAITTVVNATGKEIWDLRFNHKSGIIRLELCEHLEENEQAILIAQLTQNADYEGEGNHGSIFNIYLQDA
ncbi:MAG: hypothetical protein LKI18_05035 [Prevotella sp.]|jgi:hypothetical protein|nr:hypothetical protein [Prevotella sp.]